MTDTYIILHPLSGRTVFHTCPNKYFGLSESKAYDSISGENLGNLDEAEC
jgi:hypothetical protein